MKEPRIAAKCSIEDIADCSTNDHAESNCAESTADRAASPDKNSHKNEGKKSDPGPKSGTEAERCPVIYSELKAECPQHINGSTIE